MAPDHPTSFSTIIPTFPSSRPPPHAPCAVPRPVWQCPHCARADLCLGSDVVTNLRLQDSILKESPSSFPGIMVQTNKATPHDDGYERGEKAGTFGRTIKTKLLSILKQLSSGDTHRAKSNETPFWIPILSDKYHTNKTTNGESDEDEGGASQHAVRDGIVTDEVLENFRLTTVAGLTDKTKVEKSRQLQPKDSKFLWKEISTHSKSKGSSGKKRGAESDADAGLSSDGFESEDVDDSEAGVETGSHKKRREKKKNGRPTKRKTSEKAGSSGDENKFTPTSLEDHLGALIKVLSDKFAPSVADADGLKKLIKTQRDMLQTMVDMNFMEEDEMLPKIKAAAERYMMGNSK